VPHLLDERPIRHNRHSKTGARDGCRASVLPRNFRALTVFNVAS
jgi:hypothetical protein